MTWPPDDVELHDLGRGVKWSRSVDKHGNWVGILLWHVCDRGKLQPSGVNFENAPEWIKGPRWQLAAEDPLTVHPSILCESCGLHGFITAGIWVSA